MGPIYGQAEFLIWYRYDNNGKKSWGVLEGNDADQATGRLRHHACPLPLTILRIAPWTEDQPLPGESAGSLLATSRGPTPPRRIRKVQPVSVQPPELHLTVEGLCSAWGFNDGDEPEAFVDYWAATGVKRHLFNHGWHDVLSLLVRSHLVPALEAAGHTVEVYDIDTIHNPVRAVRIDGVEVDNHNGGVPVEVRVEGVTVPYADVLRACYPAVDPDRQGQFSQRPGRQDD
jgi:hypothetical protein